MSEWNPKLYLKFKEQRTQPAKDLISRIDLKYPERILDIGCGPGNSSKELRKKWWRAEILGLDNSRSMIENAIQEYRDINFVLADATEPIAHLGMFDIIFSNAAMQWMTGIEKLLPMYCKMLNPGGVMAMQIPNPSCMPIHYIMESTAQDKRWGSRFNDFDNGLHLHEPAFYYNILSSPDGETDIWETYYHHIMPDHESMVEWYSATAMKPYLSLLDEDEGRNFREMVLEGIKTEYPASSDGSILFPFRRIFFTFSPNCS